MPIKVLWDDDEKTIIRAEFRGKWTWEDYNNSIIEGVAMLDGITHRIDQIVDCYHSGSVPTGSAIPHILQGRKTDPDNLGLTVIVAAPIIMQSLIAVFERAFGNRYNPRHLVATLEEAHALIQADRKQVSV